MTGAGPHLVALPFARRPGLCRDSDLAGGGTEGRVNPLLAPRCLGRNGWVDNFLSRNCFQVFFRFVTRLLKASMEWSAMTVSPFSSSTAEAPTGDSRGTYTMTALSGRSGM